MDPALARMFARKQQQQQEAEDDEWKPSPSRRSVDSKEKNRG